MKWLDWYRENGLLIVWLIYAIGVVMSLIGKYLIVAHCFEYVSAIFGFVYVMLLGMKKIRDLHSDKETKDIK